MAPCWGVGSGWVLEGPGGDPIGPFMSCSNSSYGWGAAPNSTVTFLQEGQSWGHTQKGWVIIRSAPVPQDPW